MELEIIARQETESKLAKYIEEKVNFLKTDIAVEGKVRGELMDNINLSLENDLPKLYELIKTESSERQECDAITLKKTIEEVKKLNEGISNQKKNREENETNVFDMLKDFINRVKGEIEDERKDRETG